MRGLLVDLALWRARALARRANRMLGRHYGGPPLRYDASGAALLVRKSEWWHDVAAWLDGFGDFPGFRTHG